ncbi:STAS domain-containing protein [Umezawaea sp. Da 62-37]|uniref:STAS domain-containing protein n=1 Tax=Umezawaea sp. Da 62-37 TaxID=3075927 RepID=UPI0028F6C8B4|nr:STAS domain-containing protein [Umezawaea sp. Da 62-37]WNV88416.1 STAS domain-containing protein [Umezawaea sp. Da 62-37]
MRTVPEQDYDAEGPRLRVHHRVVDGAVVVVASGDVDMNTIADLEEQLAAALSPEAPVVADLTGVTFLDSTGLSALVRCHERAVRDGGSLRLVAATRAVSRPLRLTGLDRLLDVRPTLEAALEG